MIIFTVSLIVITLMLLVDACWKNYFISSSADNTYSLHDEYLGIASDVILCARRKKPSFLTMVTIKENNTDFQNDNANGIPMEVFSLHSKDIKYHQYEDPHMDFELVLPVTGTNKFIIPYNYYNRPWYMWPGSTINITLDINSTHQPKEALAYLIKGDKSINKFFRDNKHLSHYEQEVDLIKTDSNAIFWTVQENDYYFVGFLINADKDTIFKANITFNFKYIDTDDYPWLFDSARHIKRIGDIAKVRLLLNNNITLCYLHPLNPSSLESDSIHIETSYSADKIIISVVVNPYVAIVIIYFFVAVILMCCISIPQHSYKSYNHVIT